MTTTQESRPMVLAESVCKSCVKPPTAGVEGAGCSGGDTAAGCSNSCDSSSGGTGLLNKNPCVSSQA